MNTADSVKLARKVAVATLVAMTGKALLAAHADHVGISEFVCKEKGNEE